MSSLPTLIFCHGAWHTPEYWDPIKKILEDKGYRCIAPNVIYNGRAGDRPAKSMTPVVRALQEVIAAETTLGNNVVMVNHSMGGMAGTSAVKGFTENDPSRLKIAKPGHVLGLVQITAWVPVANEVSLADMVQDFWRRQARPKETRLVVEESDQGWSELRSDPAKAFYSDMSPEEGKLWASKLIKFSSAMPSVRDSVYAGWIDVPMWYLLCTKDEAIVRELQEDLARRCREAGAKVVIREIESGHSPMLSSPKETIAFVEDAVKAFSARERL